MSNPDIKEWQSALLAAGYEVGRADGVFGPATLRASLKALIGDVGGDNGHVYAPNTITERIALELIGHEAIVREAYKDSVGVWTWSVGVTNASGHKVYPRYKDNPQPIDKCLEIYVWLLRSKYAPAVVKAFSGHDLTESQFGAALSFHYNTGAIGRASWVESFKAGRIAQARTEFMNWRSPPEIIPRRKKERDLFFDGKWSADGRATVYPVRKPPYAPDWSGAARVDIRDELREAMSNHA